MCYDTSSSLLILAARTRISNRTRTEPSSRVHTNHCSSRSSRMDPPYEKYRWPGSTERLGRPKPTGVVGERSTTASITLNKRITKVCCNLWGFKTLILVVLGWVNHIVITSHLFVFLGGWSVQSGGSGWRVMVVRWFRLQTGGIGNQGISLTTTTAIATCLKEVHTNQSDQKTRHKGHEESSVLLLLRLE